MEKTIDNIKVTINFLKDVDIIKIWIEYNGIFIHTTGRSGIFLFPIFGSNKNIKFIADIFKTHKLNKSNETVYKLSDVINKTNI